MAQRIDEFVRKTIETQYERAVGFLKKHRTKLDELAKILLRQETMTVEEFVEVFDEKASAKEEAPKAE